jgi:HEAT repeat protein
MERAAPMTANGILTRLCADLLHPDKNVRIEAALEIGKLADAAAVPVLVERLGAEPDFFVRENVTWALVRMGDASVLPVIAALQGDDTGARYHAAHTLSKLADARAVPALLEALASPDVMLVQKAMYALGSIGDVRALPALIGRVGADNGELRSTLHDAVAAFGDAAIPALEARLAAHETPVAVSVEAAEILGSIGGSAVIDPLGEALRSEHWEVRFAAVNALFRQADPRTGPVLSLAIADAHPHVRMLATRAMQALT